MAQMKTLTVSGTTYTVTDPEAVSFQQEQGLTQDQQETARHNIGAASDAAAVKQVGGRGPDETGNVQIVDDSKAGSGCWSGRNTVDRLCPAFTESAAAVVCEPVAGYPLEVVSQIRPRQEGLGNPSIDNIRPIVGFAQVNLTRCGKNLFNPALLTQHNWAESDGLYAGACFTLSGMSTNISYKKNTQYTLSFFSKAQGFGEVALMVWFKYTDGTESEVISTSSSDAEAFYSMTSDAGKTVSDIGFGYDRGQITWLWNVQVEEGPIVTAFEPYKGDTFTIDLGQTVYSGSLNWHTGELTVDGKVITLSSAADITLYSYLNAQGVRIGSMLDRYYTRAEGVCSHSTVTKATDADVWTNPHTMWIGAGNNAIFWVGIMTKLGLSTVDEFKAWLDTQQVQICYRSANPVTVQLTPREILALADSNTLHSDTGDTTVTGRADPKALFEKLTNAIISLGGNV